MKFFLSTTNLIGQQKKLFGYTRPIIDLISISLISEDGREYKAISKDFNLKEAWKRDKWTLLLPIYNYYINGDMKNIFLFTYRTMKWIIKRHGKPNKQIKKEIRAFINDRSPLMNAESWILEADEKIRRPEFFGYKSELDWVSFILLFNGLPKYYYPICKDLFLYEQQLIEDHGNEILRDFDYPKRLLEECSWDKSRWSKRLFEFISDKNNHNTNNITN